MLIDVEISGDRNVIKKEAEKILEYGVSQEKRSICWEVIVSVILSKNVYMNMCPIPNGFRDRAI